MRRPTRRLTVTTLLAVIGMSACGGATRAPARAGVQPGTTPASEVAGQVHTSVGQRPYTPADVHFMAGMIPHHAQAVVIAGWAAERSTRADLRVLAERMVVAQRDEIALLQSWLSERNETVPAADATHLRMSTGGVEHDMLMPGMLSPEELAQLERAQGIEFDRLFVTFMIRHHEGALTMVDQLFTSYGAAQDDFIYKFASDLYADQSIEIERMQTILDSLPPRLPSTLYPLPFTIYEGH